MSSTCDRTWFLGRIVAFALGCVCGGRGCCCARGKLPGQRRLQRGRERVEKKKEKGLLCRRDLGIPAPTPFSENSSWEGGSGLSCELGSFLVKENISSFYLQNARVRKINRYRGGRLALEKRPNCRDFPGHGGATAHFHV